MVEIIYVLNNVTSPQRLIDAVKTAYSIESGPRIKAFIVTKVTGMAAQTGLPEASRYTYKLGKPLIILPTLKDAIELLNPARIILITKRSDNSKSLEDVEVSGSDTLMIVVSGSDSEFAKSELALGDHFHIPLFTFLTPSASIALSYYIIKRKLETPRSEGNAQNTS